MTRKNGLPRRVYLRHSAFYFVRPDGSAANEHLRGLRRDASNFLRRWTASVCAGLRMIVGQYTRERE